MGLGPCSYQVCHAHGKQTRSGPLSLNRSHSGVAGKSLRQLHALPSSPAFARSSVPFAGSLFRGNLQDKVSPSFTERPHLSGRLRFLSSQSYTFPLNLSAMTMANRSHSRRISSLRSTYLAYSKSSLKIGFVFGLGSRLREKFRRIQFTRGTEVSFFCFSSLWNIQLSPPWKGRSRQKDRRSFINIIKFDSRPFGRAPFPLGRGLPYLRGR